jgi:hypothetical protein
MSCELTRDRLDALIAGTLDPASEAQARAHLASCAECSEDYEAARFVAPRAAALPREKPSDRDLWAGIEPRLGREARGAGRAVRVLALAAALMLAVGTGWWLRGLAPRAPRPAPEASAASLPYESEVASLRSAMNELEQALMHDGLLAPAVNEAFRRDLQTLEAAISEASAALRADPANDVARELYRAAFRRKLDALRRAAAVYSTS